MPYKFLKFEIKLGSNFAKDIPHSGESYSPMITQIISYFSFDQNRGRGLRGLPGCTEVCAIPLALSWWGKFGYGGNRGQGYTQSFCSRSSLFVREIAHVTQYNKGTIGSHNNIEVLMVGIFVLAHLNPEVGDLLI